MIPKEFLGRNLQSVWSLSETHSNKQDHPCPSKVLSLDAHSAFTFYFLHVRLPLALPPLLSSVCLRKVDCTCCWRTEICFSRFLFASSSSSSCSFKAFFSSSVCFSLVLKLSFRRVSSCSSSYNTSTPEELSTSEWGFKGSPSSVILSSRNIL